MKKIATLSFLLLLTIFHGCHKKSVEPDNRLHLIEGTIWGNVYDAISKKPIFNARVEATGFSDVDHWSSDSCYTDSNGFYIVQVNSLLYLKNTTGAADLSISKNGYKSWISRTIFYRTKILKKLLLFLKSSKEGSRNEKKNLIDLYFVRAIVFFDSIFS
jgi:hypothetical protein